MTLMASAALEAYEQQQQQEAANSLAKELLYFQQDDSTSINLQPPPNSSFSDLCHGVSIEDMDDILGPLLTTFTTTMDPAPTNTTAIPSPQISYEDHKFYFPIAFPEPESLPYSTLEQQEEDNIFSAINHLVTPFFPEGSNNNNKRLKLSAYSGNYYHHPNVLPPTTTDIVTGNCCFDEFVPRFDASTYVNPELSYSTPAGILGQFPVAYGNNNYKTNYAPMVPLPRDDQQFLMIPPSPPPAAASVAYNYNNTVAEDGYIFNDSCYYSETETRISGWNDSDIYNTEAKELMVVKKENTTGSISHVSQQSIAARERRKKITEKTQELAKMVPGGNKMNTAEMLQSAYKYVTFLKAQVDLLNLIRSHYPQEVSMERAHTENLMHVLLESQTVQEKLYMKEQCLIPADVLKFMTNDQKIASESNKTHLKELLLRHSSSQL